MIRSRCGKAARWSRAVVAVWRCSCDEPSRARAVDAIGRELADQPFARQTHAGSLPRIPAPSEAEADRRSSLARDWLREIAAINPAVLDQDDRRLLAIADATARRIAREADWYWLVHDPLGLGFFGLFGPTAYGGGWHLGVLGGAMAREPIDTPERNDHYLALVEQVVDVVAAMADRLAGQARRGILMPGPQRDRALALITGAATRLAGQLRVADRADAAPGLKTRVDRVIAAWFDPAVVALMRTITDLPVTDRMGMAHLPGGSAVYDGLVRLHATLDLGPDAVRTIATDRLASIREAMAELRAEAGFSGDDAAFAAMLADDPSYAAHNAVDVAVAFDSVLARVRPRLDTWFAEVPAAPFEAAPLPSALEGGMTFGIYQHPQSGGPGRYLFNTTNLVASGLARVPALAFHELAPGHHIHLAGQAANAGLHDLVRYNSFNAFNEGWAEYAATLAGEQGLYISIGERFGRLMMDALLTARVIADTGINTGQMELEGAERFLHENAFMTKAEARSEALRYGADLPGQVVAYKLGDAFLIEQRERLRAAQEPHFDLRMFHDILLRPGARPLPIVSHDIDAACETALIGIIT